MTENEDKPFLMTIEDTFNIKNHGIVTAGTITQGNIRQGDNVDIGYPGKPIVNTIIAGIDMTLPYPISGVLFKGDNIDQTKPGMLIAAPGLLATLSKNNEDD